MNVDIEQLQEGMITASPVYSKQNGHRLVDEDVPLSSALINVFKKHSVNTVSIRGKDDREKPKPVANVSAKVLENNTMRENGKTILKIDSTVAKEAHDKAIAKTEKQFEEVAKEHDLDITGIKNTTDEIVDETLNNPQAFSSLSAIKTKDEYTYNHSVNVSILAVLVGRKLDLTKKAIRLLALGGLLHDVGKMRIPSEILNKPGKLTPEEWAIIQTHTVEGHDLLTAQKVDREVATCALRHHERVAGTGYPKKLVAQKIDIYSKIVAVCDVYSALTTQRIYKPAFHPYKAMRMIVADVGNHFDMEITKVFQRIVGIYPNGTVLKLSNGLLCRVVDQNYNLPLRPILQILEKENQKQVEGIELIDLTKRKDLFVKEIFLDDEVIVNMR